MRHSLIAVVSSFSGVGCTLGSVPRTGIRSSQVTNEQTVSIRRFRTGSVFQIVAAGAFSALVPLCILMGVFALFGMDSIKWNDQPVLGWKGFVVAPFVGMFIAAVF